MSYQSHSYREDLLHRADEERKRRREDSISYSPTAVVQMEKEQAEVDRLAASTKAYKALDAAKDELEPPTRTARILCTYPTARRGGVLGGASVC